MSFYKPKSSKFAFFTLLFYFFNLRYIRFLTYPTLCPSGDQLLASYCITAQTLAQPVSFLQFFMALRWWHINTVYHRISVMQVSWEKTHTHESKTKLGIVWILSIKWYCIWHKVVLYVFSVKCRLLTWPCQWERDNHIVSPTLGSRGFFFLMDTDGSRRSRVNEAQSAEEKKIFFLLAAFFCFNAASLSIRKKILWNPG